MATFGHDCILDTFGHVLDTLRHNKNLFDWCHIFFGHVWPRLATAVVELRLGANAAMTVAMVMATAMGKRSFILMRTENDKNQF